MPARACNLPGMDKQVSLFLLQKNQLARLSPHTDEDGITSNRHTSQPNIAHRTRVTEFGAGSFTSAYLWDDTRFLVRCQELTTSEVTLVRRVQAHIALPEHRSAATEGDTLRTQSWTVASVVCEQSLTHKVVCRCADNTSPDARALCLAVHARTPDVITRLAPGLDDLLVCLTSQFTIGHVYVECSFDPVSSCFLITYCLTDATYCFTDATDWNQIKPPVQLRSGVDRLQT